MTDRELKKHLKKLGIVLALIAVLVGALLVYTLGNKKAELSVYTNAGAGYVDNLQALGINESEFLEYLSVFGNLVNDDYNENQRTLNMATHFMENMDSTYEVQTTENGVKSYDADKINKIVKEVAGTYIKQNIEDGEVYEFHKEENCYTQNQELDKIAYCTEIKDIAKNGEEIEVTYTLAMMTKEEMAAYKTGQKMDFETYTVSANVMKNVEYEYSKYFVSNIKKI